VYMTADADAYKYLTSNNVDLFSEKSGFDGVGGIMAYNRTAQKPGKSHQLRPMNEWIVAVGKHAGLISGADWVRTQKQLGQNSSKPYCKPRSSVALLSGVLHCVCGGYMRPKLSRRKDACGTFVYAYICTTKEKSRSCSCKMKNLNGNILDKSICDELKKQKGDASEFVRRLEIGKQQVTGRDELAKSLEKMKEELAKNEKEIAALVGAIAKASDSVAEEYILKQIDEMHEKGNVIKVRISECESLMETTAVSDAKLYETHIPTAFVSNPNFSSWYLV